MNCCPELHLVSAKPHCNIARLSLVLPESQIEKRNKIPVARGKPYARMLEDLVITI